MNKRNDKTVFQVGIEAVSKIAHPRVHTQSVQAGVEQSSAFLNEYKLLITRMTALAKGETKRQLQALLDDIRFSDPISTAETKDDEEKLLHMANEMSQVLETSQTIEPESITRARLLLAARNDLCRTSK